MSETAPAIEVRGLSKHYGELTRTLSPGSMDAIASTAYRLFPDSRAARGETGEGGPERPSRAGRLFANLFRGGEW